jgi:hypothetical protein
MSEIANALAKAKERTGQTSAPFLVPGAGPAFMDPARAAAAAAAIKKARRTQRFWFILIALSLPATAYLVWSRLRPETEPVVASADMTPADIQDLGTSPSTASTTGQNAPTSPTHSLVPAAPLPNPRADLITRVSALSVTAVMPGDPHRIVIAGRIIRQGQPLDADLTFANISNGQIVFNDARGAVYSRRY